MVPMHFISIRIQVRKVKSIYSSGTLVKLHGYLARAGGSTSLATAGGSETPPSLAPSWGHSDHPDARRC